MRSRLSALEDPLEYGRRMGWLSAPSNNNTRDDKNYERLGDNTTTSSTDRERTDVNSDSMSERANTPLSACDSDNDDNKLATTEESKTCEVDGSKKKSHVVRPSALEYGRQMGWLSTSASKISDTKNTTKLPAGESESKAKGEGAKKELPHQGSLEYHEEYYSQLEKKNTNNCQTQLELLSQKKSYVIRPSALEYGRQMGWLR